MLTWNAGRIALNYFFLKKKWWGVGWRNPISFGCVHKEGRCLEEMASCSINLNSITRPFSMPSPPPNLLGEQKNFPLPPRWKGGMRENQWRRDTSGPISWPRDRGNSFNAGEGGWEGRGGCERARSSLNLAENGHLDLIKRHLTSWIDLSYLAVALSGLTGNVGFASDYALRRPLCLHTGSQSGSVRPIRKLH